MKHPRHGGRVLLERDSAEGDAARYVVTLYAPDAAWTATATLVAGGGDPELAPWEGQGAPPGWLVDGARAHLRTLSKRAVAEGWPRRVLRWRSER